MKRVIKPTIKVNDLHESQCDFVTVNFDTDETPAPWLKHFYGQPLVDNEQWTVNVGELMSQWR